MFTVPHGGHEAGHLAVLKDNGYIECGEKCGEWSKGSEFDGFTKGGFASYEILGPLNDPQIGDVVIIQLKGTESMDLFQKDAADIGIVTACYSPEHDRSYVRIGEDSSDSNSFIYSISSELEVIDHDGSLLEEPKQIRRIFGYSKKEDGFIKEPEFVRPPKLDPVFNIPDKSEMIKIPKLDGSQMMFNAHFADDGCGNRIPYQMPDPIEEDGKTYTFEKVRRSERERVDLTGQKMPFDWYLVVSCGTCHDKKRVALKDVPFKHFESK